MNEDMFTVGQAAKYCGVSRKTLFRQVKSGKIKASRTPGGHYRILKKDLESFILEKGMYPLAHNHSSRKKILIVDDDPQIQKLLTRTLQSHKYETETAANGFEAGAKVFKFKPGLVVLDLKLPDINGFEVCRQIKQNPDTAHIKILAVTGYDTEENKERILSAGADGYMAKPLDMDQLIRCIRDLLGVESKRQEEDYGKREKQTIPSPH
ncbi:MAG: response regulator [Deltaproteobacteria bacterium]|nr:response regulator [Deltaproteobacteria bacterium]